MKKTGNLIVLVIVAVLLSACAGRDFVRPDETSLRLNETTYQEILDRFGKPFNEGTQLKNEKNVKIISYAYASIGGKANSPGITPARAASFYFSDDLLAGYEFISSYKMDNSDFDETRIEQLKKGETTREQVIALIGKPAGRYVHPLIKEKDGYAMIYAYGEAFGFEFFMKQLTVSINDNVVTDVEYTTSGKKHVPDTGAATAPY
ncbi:MAG: hypothetical protein ABW089_11400 [Sedimenticola sp.]